ncbi:uncharacterized protein RAG0_12555 [Rhynchosporium agropyri]|uniref:Uncharacterized protein n=1 Tax=Rhynchosporium agropyri TaxID=914238 RepID=A0A1E1L9E7_9HELO|nr:uncharacterized protein RAG0_12555 [Rhynchosporium agropyri]
MSDSDTPEINVDSSGYGPLPPGNGPGQPNPPDNGPSSSSASAPNGPPPLRLPNLPAVTTDAMIRLSALPALRPAVERQKSTMKPFQPGRSGNHEPRLLQMVGVLQDPPCYHCATGYGRYTECVALLKYFDGTCASCHYGSEGKRCTIRPDANSDVEIVAERKPSGKRAVQRKKLKLASSPAASASSPTPTKTKGYGKRKVRTKARSARSFLLERAQLHQSLADSYGAEADLSEYGSETD